MLLSPSHEGTVWATYHGFAHGITPGVVSRGAAVVAWPAHGGTGPAMVARPGHGDTGPSHGGMPAMAARARAMVAWPARGGMAVRAINSKKGQKNRS